MNYFRYGASFYSAACRKNFRTGFLNIQVGYIGKISRSITVYICCGGRLQNQRIGENCAQKNTGYFMRNWNTGFLIEAGNQSCSRPYRFIDKSNRIIRTERSESVVVNNFLNFIVLGSVYGLCGFIVIYKNDFDIRLVQKVVFGNYSKHFIVSVNNRETAAWGRLKHGTDFRYRISSVDGRNFFIRHKRHRR